MSDIPAAIEFKNITKTFGSITANSDISFEIRRGEILSLLGENGSGKTTLMNMLSGIYYPDSGKIYINGNSVSIKSPKDAYKLGIGMIHQHFKLIDVFTVTENVVLGLPGKIGLDLKTARDRVTEICKKYGFELNPDQKVYDMNVSQKQTLEIVKLLYRKADILILDEPTAVLTPQETENLFKVIRNMRDDGKSIIIITHKLHEVLAVSDRVAILRKGEYIATVNTGEATELSLTEMMAGKKVILNIDRPEPLNPVKRIEVQGLSVVNAEGIKTLDDISFELYGGEILGIAGISGCGQKELLEAIAGLQKTGPGSSIKFHPTDDIKDVKSLIGKTPKEIRNYGIALSFVPEDRLGMGLVGSMGMPENMMLKTYNEDNSIFLNLKNPVKSAEEIKNTLEVATPSLNTPVRTLSGGNIQKVLVGREISSVPAVLMTAYAVRGLDINTSYMIYDLINEQKKRGVAVIFVGEDLDVLLAISDRILVLCGGKSNGIVDARTTTKEKVGLMMTTLNNVGGSQDGK